MIMMMIWIWLTLNQRVMGDPGVPFRFADSPDPDPFCSQGDGLASVAIFQIWACRETKNSEQCNFKKKWCLSTDWDLHTSDRGIFLPHSTHICSRLGHTAAWSWKHISQQVAQLSQRDRAAEWVSFDQKWKRRTGRQFCADIIGLSSTTVT